MPDNHEFVLIWERYQQIIPVRGQTANILGFEGHMLCHSYSTLPCKALLDSWFLARIATGMNKLGAGGVGGGAGGVHGNEAWRGYICYFKLEMTLKSSN